jgi:hypothetical protein
MAKTKNYEVELLPSNESGAKGTMVRGGRVFAVKEPVVLALTKEEAEVFENDRRFQLSETSETPSESESSESTSGSESDAQGSGDESSEEDDSSEDSDSEDSSSDEAEEDTSESTDEEASEEDVEEDSTEDEEVEEVTVESLVKNNSRNELNALAVEAGVENPEALETKPEVAQAIVDAKARNSESEDTTSNEQE